MRFWTALRKWLDIPMGSSRASWRKFWSESVLAYMYLLPAFLVLGLFSFFPVLKALQISLYDLDFLNQSQRRFVLLQNYKEILLDPLFWQSLKNTAIFVVGTVPVGIFLALGIAVLLNQPLKLRAFHRLAFFVPYITTVVSIAMVWAWIYHDQWGLLNHVLGRFGIQPQQWLLDPKWTLLTVMVMSVWKTLGYTVVIFLAGLQTIDRELYHAARVDGASSVQTFWHVTWPLLSPTTFFVSITSIIGAFKVFTELFIMYGGKPGPLRAGITIVFYIYEKAWTDYRMGYASAAAYILFFLVMLVTVIQLWYAKRRVHYS